METRGSLQLWERAALTAWWAGHARNVRGHHRGEEEIFFPFMATRFRLPDGVDEDHRKLIDRIEAVDSHISRLEQTSDTAAWIAQLHQLWASYGAVLLPHLLEEERVVLPLLRAYFTRQEVGKAMKSMMGGLSSWEVGSFVHYQSVDGFRRGFMRSHGIPLFVWYLSFKGKHDDYVRGMLSLVLALQSGNEPAAATRSWCAVM
jgi:iron-sulfur cluster repair protein YtfE (RIC family)